MLNGTEHRSPTAMNSTSEPVSMTSPVISWPRTRPAGAVVRPRTMCWSDPQMLVLTVRTMTPCGTFRPTLAGLTPGPAFSSNEGYGVSMTSTTPGSLYATALLPDMGMLLSLAFHCHGRPDAGCIRPSVWSYFSLAVNLGVRTAPAASGYG